MIDLTGRDVALMENEKEEILEELHELGFYETFD